MSVTFERKLPIILFFVFLMLATIGIVFYQNTVSLQEAIGWGRQTQEIVSTLDETLMAALDIQAGTRGFVITGNETYLESFNRAKPKITQNISELRKSVGSDQSKSDELNRLESLINEVITENTRKIDLRKSGGFEAAIYEVATLKDKAAIDAVRASIERLKQEEVTRLQRREQGFDKSLVRTIWILIITSLAGIVSLGLANFVVWHEGRKRKRAEIALIEANRGLEKKIEERTEELQIANESLREVGVDREHLLLDEKKARQEAEIANRLRDEFMATISHELRTPLNSILGWARLLKGGTLTGDQTRRAVSTIIKNSETQNRLIEDLMDVARLISGKLELEHENIDMRDLLLHAVESVKPAATAKRIAIMLDTEERHIEIVGDKNRLLQVFTNLLTNAIKFSHDDGKIEVHQKSGEDYVEVDVVDHGVGISEEFLPMVFERFRQDTSRVQKNGGLGLGLAIVRNLVEVHHGSVSVRSEGPNKGSTFTVKFPTVPKDAEART